MPRNPKTGDLMTKEELREINRQRFMDALARGDLYNTGPITEEGATSFSPDRWADYFEKNPKEAPKDWTGDSESYMEQASTTQEFVADKRDMKFYEDGKRVDEPTNLAAEDTGPVRGADNSFLTKEQEDNSKERAELQASMAEKQTKVDANEKDIAKHDSTLAQLDKDIEQIRAEKKAIEDQTDTTPIDEMFEDEEKEIQAEEKQDRIDNEQMFYEFFNEMSDEELDKWVEDIQKDDVPDFMLDAFTEVKMERAEKTRKELDPLMAQAEADQEKMEADVEERDFPNIAAGEGMMTFKKTEDVANTSENKAIDTILNSTNLNEQQAGMLMRKLKGICD